MTEKQSETRERRIAWIRQQQAKRREDLERWGKRYVVGTVTLNDIDYLLSLLQQPATSERRTCSLCSHDNVDREGVCKTQTSPPSYRDITYCGCKCVYSATGAADGPASFKDFLREQIKDPEFAAAYKEISTEVDAEVATTGAGAERADVWKIVFDVVSEHAYYGSRELVKQLETARGRDGYGPQGEPPATVTERETQYGGFADHADMAAPTPVQPVAALTELQQAMIDHDDDMARLDRNTITPSTPTPEEAAREPIRDAAAQICCLWDADDEDRQRVAEIICEYLPDAALPPTDPTPRKYFCSCGAACTAEEYIEHYFEKGHDRGEGAQVAVEAHDLEWALHELADGWIDNSQREGPYGFYRNARRVLELVTADAADAGEVERLKRAMKIRDSFLSGDEAAVGLIEIAGLLDRHFTGREGRAMTWREIIEHISDINREKEEARTDAIRECVEQVAAMPVTKLEGVEHIGRERTVARVQSLAKEGDDGPRV